MLAMPVLYGCGAIGSSMRYIVVVVKSPESSGASVSDLPCVATGESEEEVLQLIQEAIEFHLQALCA